MIHSAVARTTVGDISLKVIAIIIEEERHDLAPYRRERRRRMTDLDASGESTEISWPLDSTTVDGTLVKPFGSRPFPAVVMVAGSGPTDRD